MTDKAVVSVGLGFPVSMIGRCVARSGCITNIIHTDNKELTVMKCDCCNVQLTNGIWRYYSWLDEKYCYDCYQSFVETDKRIRDCTYGWEEGESSAD